MSQYDLCQEPRTSIRFIHPVFDQACWGNAAELFADGVRDSEIVSQHSIISKEFLEHRFGSQSFLIVISDSLLLGDVSDGAQSIIATSCALDEQLAPDAPILNTSGPS